MLGVLGPSGCGKSTLLSVVSRCVHGFWWLPDGHRAKALTPHSRTHATHVHPSCKPSNLRYDPPSLHLIPPPNLQPRNTVSTHPPIHLHSPHPLTQPLHGGARQRARQRPRGAGRHLAPGSPAPRHRPGAADRHAAAVPYCGGERGLRGGTEAGAQGQWGSRWSSNRRRGPQGGVKEGVHHGAAYAVRTPSCPQAGCFLALTHSY